MIIVANTYMLNIFKKISLFKINLGLGLIDVKSEKIHLITGTARSEAWV